ncbi:metallophosphoesterase [Opitutus sp. ER46]|uniref:metallophosphoesterase family protein n=1 Tax=Opitutus sp. ER46 TaxID=2161864 RepID=UPI000D31C07B|nr:metallophosphoesterase [Opitutus sp. ER46]
MPLHLGGLSRRQFLVRSMLAGGGVLLGAGRCLGERLATDLDAWVLFSDPHIAHDPGHTARGINMAERLATAVREALGRSTAAAGVIVNGDLAFNTGETGDYGTFARLIEPLRATGLPVHLALGNHDHRERFWAAMREAKSGETVQETRQVAVIRAPRANWFVLDTLDRTMSTPGRFGPEQLAWFAQALDANADRPAIVVAHHNPALGTLKSSLLDSEAFFAVMRPRRHVKAFIFGHTHRWGVGQDESGLHLINLPTTAYVFDPAAATGWVSAQLSDEGLRLHLHCLNPAHAEHNRQLELAWRT